MKKLQSLKIAVVLIFCSATTLAQNLSFQLQVGSEVSTNNSTMMFYSAKNKVAIQPVSGPLVGKRIIIDQSASKQHVLMTNKGQQTAMLTNSFNAQDHIQTSDLLNVRSTGETVTVDGITCEKLIVEGARSQWVLCITKDVAMDYLQFASLFNCTKGTPAPSPLVPLTDKIPGFPMRIESTDANGVTTSLSVSGVNTKPVDAKNFSMTGYKVVDMTKPVR